MTAVYTIGDVAITFERPLLDGADDPINFRVGCGLEGTPLAGRGPMFGRIAEADIPTLYEYAASRACLPWSGPVGSPAVAFGTERRPYPDLGPRRFVDRFQRVAWRRGATFDAPFQADAFDETGFDGGVSHDMHVFVLAIVDCGPGSVEVNVATDDAWRTLELGWDGSVSGSPTTVTNAEPSGWKDVGFDDSAWDAAYIPPDPPDYWHTVIGADFLSSTSRAVGHLKNAAWIARREFELETDAIETARLMAVVDNWCQIFLDGELVLDLADSLGTDHTGYWATVQSATIPAAALAAGPHCLAIHVWQDAPASSWAANPTAVAARLRINTALPA